MKKVLINTILIITFLLIYFLHSNLFTWFKIAGIMPNLFVVFILFIGLYGNKVMGITYGVICGILLDFFIGKRIGITGAMLGVVGIIGLFFDRNFSKENRITLMVMVVISTIVFEVGQLLLQYFITRAGVDILILTQMLLIECIYNIILTIILYPLIQKFGNFIEDEYKGNNILTRYF